MAIADIMKRRPRRQAGGGLRHRHRRRRLPRQGKLDWKGDKVFISGGKIGELTQKLYDTLTGIQWGKLPDTKGWIVPVCKG